MENRARDTKRKIFSHLFLRQSVFESLFHITQQRVKNLLPEETYSDKHNTKKF